METLISHDFSTKRPKSFSHPWIQERSKDVEGIEERSEDVEATEERSEDMQGKELLQSVILIPCPNLKILEGCGVIESNDTSRFISLNCCNFFLS